MTVSELQIYSIVFVAISKQPTTTDDVSSVQHTSNH